MFSFSRDKKSKSKPTMKSPRPAPRPRLERRNAAKNIDYEHHPNLSAAASFAGPRDGDGDDEDDVGSPGEALRATRSLEIYRNQTSFRIGGSFEGEVDLICRSLGLSGPEDFAIPSAAWEASRAQRLSHCSAAASRLSPPQHQHPMEEESRPADRDHERTKKTGSGGEGGIRGNRPPTLATPESVPPAAAAAVSTAGRSSISNNNNNNPSPSSVLAPPPSMSVTLPALDRAGSAWDLVRSFAPDDDDEEGGKRRVFSDEEEEEKGEEVRVGLREEMSEDVASTSNDDCDDTSSCTTEVMFVISPNGRFKRSIRSWMRGQLLGSGSFGTVYEGISDDGIFFAVKEVSLLDQGSNAQQCILQLEQEIALLSQFEHENIVQYYGTDKEEAKLFIFIELVTQGSLASLYQKYRLQDSQVSAYTRQILKGLYYLHERNVVHRDIKCANILVHANGSVKLADFGLAKEITKFNMLKSCKGSVYWMAPEVVNPRKTYGPAADIWSLGCTVLEMLTRQIPYPNLEWQHAFFKIGRGDQPPIPNHLSRDARDFISQCVRVNPEDRPLACQLLEHPFVRRPLPSSGSGSDYSSSPSNGRWH
ncbi:putative mitogen-activated protein kinase kinase kinase 1 [Iris pallida]|uniref:mitogen-activated protein kinase kinase kinase n=1 Tax=Iris pallida TaxID=29817 RepID=A0AAX6EYP5_IRIPA|nr:putative mitogen-activated protein kinase kinase kinase 1 [Iris pallida]